MSVFSSPTGKYVCSGHQYNENDPQDTKAGVHGMKTSLFWQNTLILMTNSHDKGGGNVIWTGVMPPPFPELVFKL